MDKIKIGCKEVSFVFIISLIGVLVVACFFNGCAYAEETTAGVMYERVTHYGDVAERQVRQITTKIITYNFTLNEIDKYIDMQKDQLKQLEAGIKEFKGGIKELEIMRKAVLDEANK